MRGRGFSFFLGWFGGGLDLGEGSGRLVEVSFFFVFSWSFYLFCL